MRRLVRNRSVVSLCALFFISFLLGCASVPYQYGKDIEDPTTLWTSPEEYQFERGRPITFVDGLGHYVLSLPSKLILFNGRVDNHNISWETEEKLRVFLAENGLLNVKVRLNQHAPGGEWRRLFRNTAMPGFFRYTLGILSCTFYTILPGRAFGGDNYNPYTNTINIYSDHKSIALHEAAHAKDFASRSRGFRGWYAALRLLPLVPLWQEAVATGDAIGYNKDKPLPADEKADYKILYPAYGTYVGGEAIQWFRVDWWVPYAVAAACAIPGHIIGRIKAAGVEGPPAQTAPGGDGDQR